MLFLVVFLFGGIVQADDKSCSMNDQLPSDDIFISNIDSWKNGVSSFIGLRTRNLSPDNFINSGGSPELSALCLIKHYSNIFKLNDPVNELTMIKMENDYLEYTHVAFNRIYQSVPVWSSQLVVHFNAEGKVYTINGIYHPSFNILTQPNLTADEAVEIARKDEEFIIPENITVDLVIYPKDESYLLSWNIHTGTLYQPGLQYIVGASNGEILFKDTGIRTGGPSVQSPPVQEKPTKLNTTEEKITKQIDTPSAQTPRVSYKFILIISVIAILLIILIIGYKLFKK